MTATRAHITPVRMFQEGGGRPRRHVLAVYDTGELRLLIDRGERMAIRLLAILNDGQEHECLDGPPQIQALCEEYVRQYLRTGGPLACRLTSEHLSSTRPAQPATTRHGDAVEQSALASRAVHSNSQPGTAAPGTRSSATTPTEDALGFAA
jgi:hypothetical protein